MVKTVLKRTTPFLTFHQYLEEQGYTYNKGHWEGLGKWYDVLAHCWYTAQAQRNTSLQSRSAREYTQAEIESCNAQGGSFTQEEKDNTGWK